MLNAYIQSEQFNTDMEALLYLNSEYSQASQKLAELQEKLRSEIDEDLFFELDDLIAFLQARIIEIVYRKGFDDGKCLN